MERISEVVAWLPKDHHDLVNMVVTVEMWPCFICIHYCLVSLSLRNKTGSRDYACQHPFPSWFVCVTSCFGGTLLMNFLLGRPIVEIYLNTSNIMLASLIWYLVFFSPFDGFYRLTQVSSVKVVMLILKEVHRARMISNGVDIARSLYKNNMFVITLIGSIKGSGAKFLLRPLDNFIRGNLTSDNEFLKPTFSTKHSIVCSILLYLTRSGYINIDDKMLLCALIVMAASVQAGMLLFDLKDPYEKLEKLTCVTLVSMPNTLAENNQKKKD